MKKIKLFAWFTTIICSGWFINRILDLSDHYSIYGTPVSFPIVLGTFLSCAFIPGIFWIIILIGKIQDFYLKKKLKISISSYTPEIFTYKSTIKSIDTQIEKIRGTFKILNDSFRQNLIDTERFQNEDLKLRNEINNLLDQKSQLINRIKAIENLIPVLANLILLKQKGIISEEEYFHKKNELINKEFN